MGDPAAVHEAIREEMETVLIGNDHAIKSLSIALFTGGHVLMEGVPGVAKTLIAHLFARASGLQYKRIQMTPDVMPADITGTNVYYEASGEFQLQRGPIFTNVLLADEINRATPKTQSALLEGMQEGQVTIEGESIGLPSPFIVVATQNPIEMEGTFELPEAQRDRFQLKIQVSLLQPEKELELVDRFDATPTLGPEAIDAVVSVEEIEAAKQQIAQTHVATPVKRYLIAIIKATRTHDDTTHGGSSRATLDLLNAAKARAAINGREYVIPDDIDALAEQVLAHRLVLTTDAELGDKLPQEVIDEVVTNTESPEAQSSDGIASGSAFTPMRQDVTSDVED